jgi:glutaredoxin
MREELNFEINVVNIDEDPELVKLYSDQVPVIHIDGIHHDFYKIDPTRFRSSLEKHRQHQ